ncbi:MAG: thiamine phosphate synthase [Deltaproteobacteria bacterium]|nr:thiamine phosphate synthase [Deltaproteobacteria bacterium]
MSSLETLLPRLLLVADQRLCPEVDLMDTVLEAAAAGLRFVQFREPELAEHHVAALVGELCAKAPELLVTLNGRPTLARKLGVGVHLPMRLLGADASGIGLVGRSVHTLEEAAQALAAGTHYLELGTIFPSRSKPGHPGAGPWLVRELCRRCPVPVYAIGGVSPEQTAELRSLGAHGVAVSRGILLAPDVGRAVREFNAALGGVAAS